MGIISIITDAVSSPRRPVVVWRLRVGSQLPPVAGIRQKKTFFFEIIASHTLIAFPCSSGGKLIFVLVSFKERGGSRCNGFSVERIIRTIVDVFPVKKTGN